MRYHWDTIEHCVSPETILAQLSKSGFSEIICETDLHLFRAYRSRKPTV
jgi:demethylmenaquinone methyltransferase/2-methoxy-6-polyprenyl-1,4-benzoquinol methylase